MLRLLPLFLLASCATQDERQLSIGEDQTSQGRIVRLVELSVEPAAQTNNGESSKKIFQRQGIKGWLDAKGAWHIRAEVEHGRVLCGTHETGIQLGRGNPACVDVNWFTDVAYATRQRHCNSATRVHVGGGKFSDVADRVVEVTCVRFVVRCEGIC